VTNLAKESKRTVPKQMEIILERYQQMHEDGTLKNQ